MELRVSYTRTVRDMSHSIVEMKTGEKEKERESRGKKEKKKRHDACAAPSVDDPRNTPVCIRDMYVSHAKERKKRLQKLQSSTSVLYQEQPRRSFLSLSLSPFPSTQ